MKKINKIIEETEYLEVEALINKTALVTSNRGISGLYNTNTKTFIGELDAYKNYYSKDNSVIWQIKECTPGKKLIRIYDTLEEKMIIDGWEYIANNDYIITRSPDRKYHLFDSRCFRDNNNLLNKGLDDIKSFALKDGVYYFLISENGKKGLYESNGVDTHLTSIEYDDIEKRNGFIIFTKNNKKQFRNIDYNYVSKWYDDVKFDELNPNFIYCENGSSVSVYSKRQNKIIFRYRCDEMSRISATSDSIIFLVKSNNKFGLMECKNANLSFEQPTTKVLLKPTSDEITREDGISLYYLKCNRKVGVYDYTTDKFVEPHYDKIEYLYRHILAFYTENHCDIGEIGKEPLIKDCSIKELRNDSGLLNTGSKMIYIKDYKYGLIDLKTKKNMHGFDKITRTLHEYYVFENAGKKGLWYDREWILPVEYDDIEITDSGECYNKIYMSLKADNKYKLAYGFTTGYPKENIIISNEEYSDINFYKDIFTLRSDDYLYICNYLSECIMTCVPDAVVTEIKTDNKRKNLYCINGVYYNFINRKLQEVLVESRKCFVTTFETDLEVFELTTSDEEVYKKFNEDMDSLGDVLAEEYLSNSETVKENYPKLTLKRLKKPQN